MIIDYSYKVKNKGFSTEHEALINLFIELYHAKNEIYSLSKIKIIQNECKLTDILQELLDTCNKNVFSSFKLELVMTDDKKDVY
jgi:hypothetical protein